MSGTPPSRLSTPPISPQPRASPSVSSTIRAPSGSSTLVIDHFSAIQEMHKGTAITIAIPNTNSSRSFGSNGHSVSQNKANARFYFAVFPKNALTWVANDVLTCLYFYEEDIEVKYRVAIVNTKKEKKYSQEYRWHKHGKSGHHTAKFISREELLDPANCYLINDRLTITCEIDILPPSNLLDLDLTKFSTFSDDLQALLHCGKLSDATIRVGCRELTVHKAILAARSPVFAKMFETEVYNESKKNAIIDITDLEADVCEQMLRWIYAEKIDCLEQLAPELLAAADKYQLDSLKLLLEHYISSRLTVDTVSGHLLLSDTHSATLLKSKCIDYITDNMAKVKHTEAWKSVTNSRPELGIELLLNLSAKHEVLKCNKL